MTKRLDKWLHDNIADVMKWADYFALTAFCVAAAIGCLVGNWPYMIANICAAVWVMIARNGEHNCEFYSKMLADMTKQYEELFSKYIALKKSLDNKDNANDCK